MTFNKDNVRRNHQGRRFPWTRFKRALGNGIKDLWAHRTRSLLTALGIVFGVCSVISMLAIGEGASFEAQEQIRQLGSNNIILRSIKPPANEKNTAETTYAIEYGLTYKDVDRIKETIPGVDVIVPARIIRKDVWRYALKVDCDLYNTIPWYPEMSNLKVLRGRYFTDIEMEKKSNVLVLGQSTAKKIFPIESPIGKRVRIGEEYYRVVGILADQNVVEKTDAERALQSKRGESGTSYRAYLPLTTGEERFGRMQRRYTSGSREVTVVELHQATVRLKPDADVIMTARIIGELLNRHHEKNDYEVVVPLELLRQAERTTRIFNVVLGAIAAISLVVGGIGIMNIMLASVTERTREIGIRRALGAKRRDIVMQFLVETVLLSAIGGLIGVAIGVTVPAIIEKFADMKTIVELWSPVIAFSISAIVGVVFGIYPAMRAAAMDPVEALRHE